MGDEHSRNSVSFVDRLASSNASIQCGNNGETLDLMPLYMSLIAGLSTCLGAVWVLWQRRPTRQSGRTNEPVIPESTMSFSLALAGSVMVTVSVVSILPECLREEGSDNTSFQFIPIQSQKFVSRLVFHILGYVLYYLLAKFAFPEPDETLGFKDTSDKDAMDVETQELLERSKSSDSLTKSKSPTKNEDKNKARNRRLDNNNRLQGNSNDSTNSLKDLDKIDKHDDNHNKEKNKEKSTDNKFFKQLSRYSSGADLQSTESKRAWRVAMLLFLSLSLHNFPEGLAVAASAMVRFNKLS